MCMHTCVRTYVCVACVCVYMCVYASMHMCCVAMYVCYLWLWDFVKILNTMKLTLIFLLSSSCYSMIYTEWICLMSWSSVFSGFKFCVVVIGAG